jgi:type IV pilus assembly protein PilA
MCARTENAVMKKIKKNQEGFTLVEIIVVLVILTILAAITIPAMTGFIDEADDKANVAEARTGYVAAQAFITEQCALKKYKSAKSTTSALISGKAIADCPDRMKNYMKGSASDGAAVGAVTVDANGKITSFQYKVNGQTITITPGSDTKVE